MSRLVLLLGWLAVLSCSSDPPISSQKPEVYPAAKVASAADRAALVAFYRATGGNGWDRKDNWLSDAPVWQWYGVDANLQGRVVQLRILQNNLRGKIPSQLADMDQLERLIVVNNIQLEGEIPSSLGNLENLKTLRIAGNRLTGEIPSSLGNLENLTELGLQENRLTGEIPSSLGNLENLEHLWLSDNRLSGPIPSSLDALLRLQSVYIRGNRLTGCIPSAWRSAAINTWSNDFDETGLDFCLGADNLARDPKEAFNIDLVYLDNGLTSSQKSLMESAARRWEQIIVGDVPDINFSRHRYNEWDTFLNARIQVNDTVDDLRVFVRAHSFGLLTADNEQAAGSSSILLIRTSNWLPILSTLSLNTDFVDQAEDEGWLEQLMLHEMGHTLGVGASWAGFDLIGNPSAINKTADTYFRGFQARRAFNQVGGRSYEGQKVPVQQGGDDIHWRRGALGDELMIAGWVWPFETPISAITVASLADLGYRVNPDAADYYWLPSPAAAKPQATTRPGCAYHAPPVQLVDEDGRVSR